MYQTINQNQFIMTTLVKITVSAMLTMLFLSCNFMPGVTGDGNVKTQEREVAASFTGIHTSNGLDVILTQDDFESIKVQADENLHDIITTEVENGVLKISTTKNIGSAKSKKVMVSFKDLETIKSTSGSDLRANGTLIFNNIDIEATSGCDINLSVEAQNLSSSATSGADLKLEGTATTINLKATSGADIDAKNLTAINAVVGVTSGADIKVHATESIELSATSGGDIKYYGNPQNVVTSEAVSGSIKPVKE